MNVIAIINRLALLMLLLLFSSCGFSTNDKIVGYYYMVAVDVDEQMCVCYYRYGNMQGCSGVIESTVFAVGFNDRYIIAKQHPDNAKNITNYYIVSLRNGPESDNDTTYGPLTMNQFDSERIKLGIPDSLKFTMENKSLE